MDVKQVVPKLMEALEIAKQVKHSDMLCYLIETALTEAREDYYRRLPADHPDRKSPAL